MRHINLVSWIGLAISLAFVAGIVIGGPGAETGQTTTAFWTGR